ncbi:MAG: protein CpxP [Luteibaculaceae bacterium]|jgi:protein CpxP
MEKLKLYKFTTLSLLILNIGLIVFFFISKPNHPPHMGPKDLKLGVVEALHLNNNQASQFKYFAEEHHTKMRVINGQQQELLWPYFKSISDTSIHFNEEEAFYQHRELEKEKIQVTRQHFEEVKSILKEDQLPYFNDFVNQFIENVLMKGKENHPPKNHPGAKPHYR